MQRERAIRAALIAHDADGSDGRQHKKICGLMSQSPARHVSESHIWAFHSKFPVLVCDFQREIAITDDPAPAMQTAQRDPGPLPLFQEALIFATFDPGMYETVRRFESAAST